MQDTQRYFLFTTRKWQNVIFPLGHAAVIAIGCECRGRRRRWTHARFSLRPESSGGQVLGYYSRRARYVYIIFYFLLNLFPDALE